MAAAGRNEAQKSGIRSRFADEVGFLWGKAGAGYSVSPDLAWQKDNARNHRDAHILAEWRRNERQRNHR